MGLEDEGDRESLPVWLRRCTVRLEQFLKTLPQNSHVSLRRSRLISRCGFGLDRWGRLAACEFLDWYWLLPSGDDSDWSMVLGSPVWFCPLVLDRLSTEVEHGGVADSDGDECLERRLPPPLSMMESASDTREWTCRSASSRVLSLDRGESELCCSASSTSFIWDWGGINDRSACWTHL